MFSHTATHGLSGCWQLGRWSWSQSCDWHWASLAWVSLAAVPQANGPPDPWSDSSCWHPDPCTDTRSWESLSQETVRGEFKNKAGQAELVRYREWPDKHTSYTRSDSLSPLILTLVPPSLSTSLPFPIFGLTPKHPRINLETRFPCIPQYVPYT